MKILLITDLYPVKQSEKYTPKTVYDFAAEWKNLGHEVKVIKPNFILNSFLRGKPYYKNGVYGDVENVNYWLPFIGNIDNKLKNTNFDEYDYIIAHMPSGIIFANRLRELLNLSVPFIAAVHVSDLEVLTKPLYSIYFKSGMERAYAKAAKIACRSEVLRRKFLKIFPEYEEKTFVAYSGINSECIVKRQWKPGNKVKIMTCANMKKRKNIDKVILACNSIKNTELTVVGDGYEYKNLKKLGGENVIFTGHLPNDSVLNTMRQSDIFILPSENETFGMVYLEAMASGCITVGLKGDGIDGIIKHGENGYLCTKDNIKSLLEEIINSNNQNLILENCCNTINSCTKENAALNYLNHL